MMSRDLGEWKRNKEHGRGKLMTSDRKRVIYDGEWERGRMHGRGVFYYSSGVTLNSRQQIVFDDGKGKKKGSANNSTASNIDVQSRYEGEFRDGAR